MPIKLTGNTGGSVSFDAPDNTSPGGTDVTLTLPTSAGSAGQYLRNSGTAGTLEFGALPSQFTYGTPVASTSGTAIEFQNLPDTIKRITVFFYGVSLTLFDSQNNSLIVRLGSGSPATYKNSGYTNASGYISASSTANNQADSTGFSIFTYGLTSYAASGRMVFTNAYNNLWTVDSAVYTGGFITFSAGIVDLGATLTAIQVTTPGGTDTFDAGSINIMYEG